MQNCDAWGGRRNIRHSPTPWQKASCRVCRTWILDCYPDFVISMFDHICEQTLKCCCVAWLFLRWRARQTVLVRIASDGASLTDWCSFGGKHTGSRAIPVCFAKQLADHVFDRHLLHVYVADVAGLEKSPAGFSNLCAWNLQLHRDRCLFGDFTERGQVACLFFFESKTQNFIARKTIDDLCQRAVEKDLAVIDHQHAVTQLLDVLHVMAGEQCDDAMFLIVDPQ